MAHDIKSIEETLTKRLSRHLDKTEISRVAKLLATLSDNGIEIDDVFPYGIPSQLDSISVRGYLNEKQVAEVSAMLPKLGAIKDYRIFPRGIVVPDRFRMHLNLNR